MARELSFAPRRSSDLARYHVKQRSKPGQMRAAPDGIVVHDLELQRVGGFLSTGSMAAVKETESEDGAMHGISHSNFQVGSSLGSPH